MRFPLMLLILALPLAQASLTEDVTGTAVQRDGGIQGDASGACQRPRPLAFPLDTQGALAPADDPMDFYRFDVPTARVGTPVTVRLAASIDLDLYLYEPGCGALLASSRGYTGTESVTFTPAAAGGYTLLVRLFSAVSDDFTPRVELAGYDLSLR